MRRELAGGEWIVIKPMLPNKPRGVPRVDDRATWRIPRLQNERPGSGFRALHADCSSVGDQAYQKLPLYLLILTILVGPQFFTLKV